MLDSGSQRSQDITDELAKRLELKGHDEQEIRLVTFGSEKHKVIKTKSTKLDIKLNNGEYMTISVNIVPKITGTIHRKPVILSEPEHFSQLTQNLKLTIPSKIEPETVKLLIGNDYY